ncbi:MAG TPA: type II toxin-antitoxin system RelE/ParE family toxin [Dermatophilaceae bacterium]|nr:type II toxin-antitoxin system RelE/ParE family toxin [Dermatophilaceae bacterium]
MASPAVRNLEHIPPRYAAAILEFIYAVLPENPGRVGKPLERELEGLYGAHRGDYRVVYEIRDDDTSVLVVRIDHRAHVYRSR